MAAGWADLSSWRCKCPSAYTLLYTMLAVRKVMLGGPSSFFFFFFFLLLWKVSHSFLGRSSRSGSHRLEIIQIPLCLLHHITLFCNCVTALGIVISWERLGSEFTSTNHILFPADFIQLSNTKLVLVSWLENQQQSAQI